MQSIATIGKSILAHVNIRYDGASGLLHIDILPTDEMRRNDQNKIIVDQTTEHDENNGGSDTEIEAPVNKQIEFEDDARMPDFKREGRMIHEKKECNNTVVNDISL